MIDRSRSRPLLRTTQDQMEQNTHYKGVFYLFLSMVVSCTNDVISKYIGKRLSSIEVTFFRFLFSLIILLPFVFQHGVKIFDTKHPYVNIVRGLLGTTSLFLSTFAVVTLPLPQVTVIFWTIPLFQLVLAAIILHENVTKTKWIATCVGFLGLSYLTLYGSEGTFAFEVAYFAPIIASVFFALSDVIVKTVIDTEDHITMLLYFSVVSTALAIVPALLVWETPTLIELFELLLLGIGADLIQFFTFKAYSYSDLSSLAPYRYVEFVFSAFFSLIFFSEIPDLQTIAGVLILVPSTLYVTLSESKPKSTLPTDQKEAPKTLESS